MNGSKLSSCSLFQIDDIDCENWRLSQYNRRGGRQVWGADA